MCDWRTDIVFGDSAWVEPADVCVRTAETHVRLPNGFAHTNKYVRLSQRNASPTRPTNMCARRGQHADEFDQLTRVFAQEVCGSVCVGFVVNSMWFFVLPSVDVNLLCVVHRKCCTVCLEIAVVHRASVWVWLLCACH